MVTLVIPGGWSPSVDIRVDNILSLKGKTWLSSGQSWPRQRVGSEVEWCGKLSATTSYRKPNNQVVFYASTSSFLLCKPAVFWSDPAICLDLLSFQETPSSTASTFHLKNIHNSRIICSFLGLNIV